MTYKQTLELELKLWEWLYLNPGKQFEDSPFWKNLYNLTNYSPLCDYHKIQCSKCILYKKKLCCTWDIYKKLSDNTIITYWDWEDTVESLMSNKHRNKDLFIYQARNKAFEIFSGILEEVEKNEKR